MGPRKQQKLWVIFLSRKDVYERVGGLEREGKEPQTYKHPFMIDTSATTEGNINLIRKIF